ncbi:MAG: hypothetical protein ACFB2W_26275 [Leptolyngbyaceae cyanobacterium]
MVRKSAIAKNIPTDSAFSRRLQAVIAVDPVDSMRVAAQRNLAIAAQENDWFDISRVL